MPIELDVPLSVLPLPARLENYAERKGFRTVRELVEVPPAALLLERNMGRKTVADVENALKAHFGVSWARLRAELGLDVSAAVAGTGPESRWHRLRASGLSERMSMALARVPDLPARMMTFASSKGFVKLEELVACEWELLQSTPGLGRRTVQDTLDALEAFVSAPIVDPLVGHVSWLSFLRARLGALPSDDRLILTQRSGLSGPAPTLAELGELLGVSRERIRQRESRALALIRSKGDWRDPLLERLRRAADGRALVSVAELATADSFFIVDAESVEPFRFFVDEVLAGELRIVMVQGESFVSPLGRELVDARLDELRTVAEGLRYPVDITELEAGLAASLDWTLTEVQTFAPLLATAWLREGNVVTGFGRRREDVVLAFLRGAGVPVAVGDIEDRFGRGKLPTSVVFVERGLVTVPELVPDWERWVSRLGGACARIMSEAGPTRQWTTEELVPALMVTADLPPWLNAWTLGSALRETPEVRYLGRNTVSLPDVHDERLMIFETALEILESSGTPLEEVMLLTELRARRGVSANAWNGLRLRRPILLMGGDRVGLLYRDVPGGQPEAARAVEAVFARLASEQIGLSSGELVSLLAGLGGAASSWDPKTARSVLRHDGRFRLAHGGAVGLAEWEDARAARQTDVLRQMLESEGGVMDLSKALGAIPTPSGDLLSATGLRMLSSSMDARVRDGALVLQEPAPSERGTLPETLEEIVASVPEAAGAAFRRFLREPGTRESVTEELATWRAWVEVEAETNICIERDQVALLLEIAERLLAVCAHGDARDEATTARLAAVRYLACVDDGESDAVLGGLDDDEAVLRSVDEWSF